MHSSLQKVLSTLNLPPLGRLQSSKQRLHTPSSDELNNVHHEEEILPSCDASPKALPEDDHDLPKPPIQSLYHLTKLSALRSPDTVESNDPPSQRGAPIDDFISRGILPIEEAQRLFNLYMNHLDHFMYGIGGRHKTLDVLRRSSRILTVSILTVAALHDHQSNSLYGVCSKEFRRQLAASFLNRRIDRDYLRAMVRAKSMTVAGNHHLNVQILVYCLVLALGNQLDRLRIRDSAGDRIQSCKPLQQSHRRWK